MDSKVLNLGVVNVPKAIKEQKIPLSPSGKKGKKNHLLPNKNKEDSFDPFCEERDPRIIFKFDERNERLLINPASEHGKEIWDRPPVGDVEDWLNRLYGNYNIFAVSIFRGCKKTRIEMTQPAKLPDAYHLDSQNRNETDDCGDEPWDYLINEALTSFINDPTSEFAKLISKIRQKYEQKSIEMHEKLDSDAA